MLMSWNERTRLARSRGRGTRPEFLPFMVGYLLFFNLTVFIGQSLNSKAVVESWTILGNHANSVKLALLWSPVLGSLFGSMAASVSIRSYGGLGNDRLTFFKVLEIVFSRFLFFNWATVVLALRVLLDEKLGTRWVQHIGLLEFNGCLFIASPVLGFAGGIVMVIVAC